ncbi:MAG: AbrB/MazE/SpoVT family DNA-binding domain-containing protein [Nitrososphaerales archaeon]
MKFYQVTRKLQVTIPKKIAQKTGIKPGDSVIFEERKDGIFVKKIAGMKEKPEELISVIQDFAADVARVRKHVREARDALNEDLSRNIPT